MPLYCTSSPPQTGSALAIYCIHVGPILPAEFFICLILVGMHHRLDPVVLAALSSSLEALRCCHYEIIDCILLRVTRHLHNHYRRKT